MLAWKTICHELWASQNRIGKVPSPIRSARYRTAHGKTVRCTGHLAAKLLAVRCPEDVRMAVQTGLPIPAAALRAYRAKKRITVRRSSVINEGGPASLRDAGKLWKRNLSEKVLLALFDYTISSMYGRIVFCFLRNCEAFATKWWIASFFWYFQYILFFRSHAWNTEKILMSNGAASPNWLLENFKENLKEALKAGAKDFIQKPLDNNQIKHVLDTKVKGGI